MKATSNDYYQQQVNLLPTGFAWTREQNGVVNRILYGLSLVWTRIHNRILSLVEESDPQTARETLIDWERNLGLPDECTSTATTLQERRAAVIEKYITKGNQAVNSFYEMAQDLGYNITIQEHKPFICGISKCGSAGDVLNGGHEVRFVWTVTPKGSRLTRFRCGVSASPERLCKVTRAKDLECRLNKNSYGHTLLVMNYEEIN